MGAQPPPGPDELKAPPMEGQAFVRSLHAQMKARYPEPPIFFQALYNKELSMADLQMWAKDLYHYWDNGVVYSTAAIFIKTNDEPLRTHMLRRMVDIEGEDVTGDLSGATTPAWEELWLRFAEGLGLKRDDVLDWQTFSRTHYATTTLVSYSRYWDWSWLDGVATFYAADLHGQAYFGRVAEALQHQYGVPAGALEFFRVFLDDVASHIPWEEEALAYWACTTERQITAARAFRERLDIERQGLFGGESARKDGKLPFQVPGFVMAAGDPVHYSAP